jgi:hypothetical protein
MANDPIYPRTRDIVDQWSAMREIALDDVGKYLLNFTEIKESADKQQQHRR